MTQQQPARGRHFVTPTQGRDEWAQAAHQVLIEVARQYNRVISDVELARAVQSATARWTRTPAARWLPGVLNDVGQECHLAAEPPLLSLVLSRDDGRVTPAYLSALALPGPLDDETVARAAAAGRLQCYVRWSRDLPLDACPTLPPKVSFHSASG